MSTGTQYRQDYSHVTPAELGELSADDFREIVNIDLKRSSASPGRWIAPAVSEALRSPDFRERWLSTLTSILLAVDTQLSSRQADHFRQEAVLGKVLVRSVGNPEREASLRDRIADERANFWTHRAKTLRFRLVVLNAIHEAQLCCRVGDSYSDILRYQRDERTAQTRILEDGIRLHRELVMADLAADEAPDEIDVNLWSLLSDDS